jgi:hypothetical protein
MRMARRLGDRRRADNRICGRQLVVSWQRRLGHCCDVGQCAVRLSHTRHNGAVVIGDGGDHAITLNGNRRVGELGAACADQSFAS